MLETARRREFESMASQLSRLMDEVWSWHTGPFQTRESWSPRINVYQLPERLEVHVDLAGLDPSQIDLHAEPGRLSIRGERPAPEPEREPDEPMRILAMEIDHGPFCREIPLPRGVDISRIESTYRNGFLRILLPMQEQG